MLSSAGPDLDRLIERKLNGDAKKRTPPYSTSEKAASRLLRRLEMQDMPCTVEEIDGVWYCTIWIVSGTTRERLATGSGETRALAIARGVLNARLGMDRSLSTTRSEAVSHYHWTAVGVSREVRNCQGCGTPLPTRHREVSNVFCGVCSWRAFREH
jgi:hypothetical protein